MLPIVIVKNGFKTKQQRAPLHQIHTAKCAHCGYALLISYSWNTRKTKRWRYFLDAGAYRVNGCAKKCLTLRPSDVEEVVFNAMKDRIDKLVIVKNEKAQPDAEEDNLKAEIICCDDEIRKLMDKLANADAVLFDYIQERISVLHKKKSGFEEKLRTKTRKHKQIDTAPLVAPMSRWDSLTVHEKHALAVTMIDVVRVSDEYGIDIQFSI